MKTKELLKISLRQNAIFIPSEMITNDVKNLSGTTSVLLANVSKLGFTFSESLLHALNNVNPNYKVEVLEVLREVLGTDKNWTPLVKEWNVPTGESVLDHVVTYFWNVLNIKSGTTLQCGHIIPDNTFPLERYNGCPFCGTPFEFWKIEKFGQRGKLKVLELWSEKDLNDFYISLLQSKTALDATQVDSLKMVMKNLPLPKTDVAMKETLMLVIDLLIENGKEAEASQFLKTPTDILRYLWYKNTGMLQIIEPKTIIKRTSKNAQHLYNVLDTSVQARIASTNDLKLKYSRKECLMVANWLNNMDMEVEAMCETMHPKRGMWVRFIRALRLAEYSKRKGFEKLNFLMDVFYNQVYDVWQSKVNKSRLKFDADKTFALLKQRPGLFARSLFSNMLWFGADETVAHFTEIIDKVPARLVFTLNMYAQNYFDKNMQRSVKPLGGTNKRIAPNALLNLYDEDQLEVMKNQIEALCLLAMKKRFAAVANTNKTIYIDPQLFNIPVSIGDRSETVQDLPVALMGTRFPIEGNEVRLFMQWGKDLPAQHLDMDLSCHIAYEDKADVCSFSRLTTTGCQHSGDIRSIPSKVGTAEYININIDELAKAKAKFVTFTCNAYSNGSITPNLVVGWMNSKHPMKISEKSGVAYDPSCVDHQVRVTQNVAKGLVFGVLNVAKREIVWLEMTFGGQVVGGLDFKGVQALLAKLSSKLNIGSLLQLKAEAQGLTITEDQNADEVYDAKWAINAVAVTQLLID
ncbi:hypothetical protein FLA105534_02664 [Flavobacterium bizetiae]|uniref:Prokaryotic RING finger family 4 n=1 Tax=Flavobacterium bizetiae TaxID=2704140 RepID=A0A6J4GN55_9FLAO|nr:hypothetical protein [Flavobacterium bizetiae]CAA9199524.1 hypothetical protein FLA105534_02664 [Flavobacterium bizetiae]CAD5341218.1 hypothetical protein FLA105535_01182 [Flavobacterium bizetiae]CAD5349016.1 hypothetical protein FLA105534_02993 [Flavobacterium bizetiae]